MTRGSRLTVDRGIYRDGLGYEVVARVGSRRQSKRFPAGTALSTLRSWRDAHVSELREDPVPVADTRTIAAAIAFYIKRVDPDDPSQLRAWLVLGELQRQKLTAARAQMQIDRWKAAGLSRQTLRLRKIALRKLWHALDGPKAKTPVDTIVLPKPRRTRPHWVPDDVIAQVFATLRAHRRQRLLRDSKTLARFMVLASTGQRPIQVARATPGDVDRQRRIWFVRAAKGGERIPLPLNREMYVALRLFAKVKAWGRFDRRNFTRVLRRCGWPPGIRPYNLRHATALTLRSRGADLADVQDVLGHADMSTTRIYGHIVEDRLLEQSARLEGRFGWGRVARSRGTNEASS